MLHNTSGSAGCCAGEHPCVLPARSSLKQGSSAVGTYLSSHVPLTDNQADAAGAALLVINNQGDTVGAALLGIDN